MLCIISHSVGECFKHTAKASTLPIFSHPQILCETSWDDIPLSHLNITKYEPSFGYTAKYATMTQKRHRKHHATQKKSVGEMGKVKGKEPNGINNGTCRDARKLGKKLRMGISSGWICLWCVLSCLVHIWCCVAIVFPALLLQHSNFGVLLI